MANFEGTIQEFHHFLGPRVRNAINNLTRKYRKERNGVCEDCGKREELQSAHVHGRERRKIIESVLSEHAVAEDIIRCNLQTVEKMILEAHLPIGKTFRFLCHNCHVTYDSIKKNKRPIKKRKIKNDHHVMKDVEFKKIHRIKLWANRPHQDNHRIIRAFLFLEKQGDVTLDALRKLCTNKDNKPKFYISKFDGHYASMKTDKGNSHGKVFYDDYILVYMWPPVKEEVRKHFEKNSYHQST